MFKFLYSVDFCLNDSVNHFILGKWVECKRASPKERKNNINNNNHNVNNSCNGYHINNNNQLYFNKFPKQKPLHCKYKYNYRHLEEENQNDNFYEHYYAKNDPQEAINLFIYQEENPNKQEEDNLKNGLKEKEINDINNTLFIKTDNSNNNSFLNLSNADSEKEEIINTSLNNHTHSISNHNFLSHNHCNSSNEKGQNLNVLSDKIHKLFQDYFNNCIKNPKFYSYFHYKLFDINGEEASSLSSYQNTTKVHLFKSETDNSTSDKASDHSSNNSNSGSNNFNSGSNNSNSSSLKSGSGSSPNSNLCNSNSNSSQATKTSKPSFNSSHLYSSNLSDSIVTIESNYRDSEEEKQNKETNAYYGPRIHKTTKIPSVNTFQPY